MNLLIFLASIFAVLRQIKILTPQRNYELTFRRDSSDASKLVFTVAKKENNVSNVFIYNPVDGGITNFDNERIGRTYIPSKDPQFKGNIYSIVDDWKIKANDTQEYDIIYNSGGECFTLGEHDSMTNTYSLDVEPCTKYKLKQEFKVIEIVPTDAPTDISKGYAIGDDPRNPTTNIADAPLYLGY